MMTTVIAATQVPGWAVVLPGEKRGDDETRLPVIGWAQRQNELLQTTDLIPIVKHPDRAHATDIYTLIKELSEFAYLKDDEIKLVERQAFPGTAPGTTAFYW